MERPERALGGEPMAEKASVSKETIEALAARIEALEKRLEETEDKDKKDNDSKGKTTTQKVTDTLSDASSSVIKESGRLLGSMVDATSEAIKESAHALSSLSEDTDAEKLGDVPAAFLSIFRKSLDVQKKVLDKFEESYDKYDD